MKTKILIAVILTIVIAGVLLTLKKDTPSLGGNGPIDDAQIKDDVATNTGENIAAGTYTITPGQTIGWNAKKRVGGGHNGTVDISKATFETDGAVILKADLEFALDTITALDLELGKGKEKLENDLKGKDFFNVETYKTGTFVLTSSAALVGGTALLTGDLTIKGKTQEISIPVVVRNDSGMVTITGTFSFNRTKFNINYASASIPGAVKDVIIEDEVGITIANTFKKD